MTDDVEYEALKSGNVGDSIHAIMNVIPRSIMVKIHEDDNEALDMAVYWLRHTEVTLPCTIRDIPGTKRIKFTRAQIKAIVDMVFAIVEQVADQS